MQDQLSRPDPECDHSWPFWNTTFPLGQDLSVYVNPVGEECLKGKQSRGLCLCLVRQW